MITEEEYPLHPFLFMGCWNEPSVGRDAVAKAISEHDIKTVVLGGDNLYPERDVAGKKKDPRIYSREVLEDGFRRLGADKRLSIALGNHNVVDAAVKHRVMELGRMTTTYVCKIFKDGCAIVVLDTNLVDSVADWGAQLAWLAATIQLLQERKVPYYCIQHEPFISYKKAKLQELAKGGDILGILCTYPPVLILCADTHNYQEGTIEIGGVRMRQVVVGTGGAHHDIIGVRPEGANHGSLPYRLENHVPGFGYLEVRGLGAHAFKHVLAWPAKGGRSSRRIKKAKRRRFTRR